MSFTNTPPLSTYPRCYKPHAHTSICMKTAAPPRTSLVDPAVSHNPFPASAWSTYSLKQSTSSAVLMRPSSKSRSCKVKAKDFLAEAKELIAEAKEYLHLSDEKKEDDGAVEELVSEGSPQTAVLVPKEREGDEAGMERVGKRWKELHGLNRWKGLIDPLDLDLRRTLLFYGDFTQAVYDSFENDEHSKYTGACRFAKEDFFKGVCLVKGRQVHYDVVRYLYATSPGLDILKSFSSEAWSKESDWIGYVAVADDEATKVIGRRDIVIVWRGTQRPFEWVNDFNFRKDDITTLLSQGGENSHGDKPHIEQGFLSVYTSTDDRSPFTTNSARDQVLAEVRALLEQYEDEDVSVTVMGHSLGAALATLNAFDITLNKLNVRDRKETVPVTAFVFACPSVGDEAFRQKCEELEGLRVLRVKNDLDIVPKVPGKLLGFSDVGVELLVSSLDSPFLKKSMNAPDWHNLEVYLHLVAGTQGKGKEYKLTINRDVSLVNKSCEALLDDYLIPESWWQMQYRGLVQRDDGFWFMPDREEGKRPKPEPLPNLKTRSTY